MKWELARIVASEKIDTFKMNNLKKKEAGRTNLSTGSS